MGNSVSEQEKLNEGRQREIRMGRQEHLAEKQINGSNWSIKVRIFISGSAKIDQKDRT
jgi:hypothetical protein